MVPISVQAALPQKVLEDETVSFLVANSRGQVTHGEPTAFRCLNQVVQLAATI